jgi:hypothetical protein
MEKGRIFPDVPLTSMRHFEKIIEEENYDKLERWAKVLGREHKNLFYSFMLLIAVKHYEIAWDRKLFKRIDSDEFLQLSTLVKSEDRPIYRSIIPMLHDQIIGDPSCPLNRIRVYNTLFARFYGEKPADLVNEDESEDEHDKYLREMYLIKDGQLCEASEFVAMIRRNERVDMFHLYLINYLNLVEEGEEELMRWNLYKEAMNRPYFLSALNFSQLAMLPKITSRPRKYAYRIECQTMRASKLDQLKLNGSTDDESIYEEMYKGFGGVDETDFDLVLESKQLHLVENYFLRHFSEDYKSEWILTAIKKSSPRCFEVLLQERVPLPKPEELARVFAEKPESEAMPFKKLIEKHRRFYDEDGLCIYGPKECRSEPYLKNAKNDFNEECFPLGIVQA